MANVFKMPRNSLHENSSDDEMIMATLHITPTVNPTANLIVVCASLTTLATEILLVIIAKLDQTSRLSLARSSRFFNRLVTPFLYHSVDLKSCSDLWKFFECIVMALGHGVLVRNFVLHAIRFNSRYSYEDEDDYFWHQQPSLKELGFLKRSLDKVIKSSTSQHEKLWCAAVTQDFNIDTVLAMLFPFLPLLKELHVNFPVSRWRQGFTSDLIHESGSTTLFGKMKKISTHVIKRANREGFEDYSNYGILHVLLLELLKLPHLESFSGVLDFSLSRTLPERYILLTSDYLKYLEVRGLEMHNLHYLVRILLHSFGLTSVLLEFTDLQCFTRVDYNSLDGIFEIFSYQFPSLEQLSLEYQGPYDNSENTWLSSGGEYVDLKSLGTLPQLKHVRIADVLFEVCCNKKPELRLVEFLPSTVEKLFLVCDSVKGCPDLTRMLDCLLDATADRFKRLRTIQIEVILNAGFRKGQYRKQFSEMFEHYDALQKRCVELGISLTRVTGKRDQFYWGMLDRNMQPFQLG